MSLRIVSSPWASFSGEKATELRAGDVGFCSAGVMPRLLGPELNHTLWNSSPPVLASAGGATHESQWDLPLSTTSGEQSTHTVLVGGEGLHVGIANLPARAHESLRDADRREQWLLWQLQRYAELASMDISVSEVEGLESKLPLGSRRSWQTVESLWQMGSDEAAELSLIVRLAKRARLAAALRAIELSPRRVLERRHVPQRISRIQEMDSATLRAYSRAPGRNAVQKAGSKQELLAVVRADTVDLAENRVLLWCARKMGRMATAYCERNSAFAGSERVRLVRQLGRTCRRILNSPRLAEVRDLPHHLTTPTYCLQFESRYRSIWRVYRELRRQDRLIDDAWRWHAHLWGTTSRLLMASMLSTLDGWSEPRISTPYFLTEGMCGEWTCGPSTPGPYESPQGLCHVLDFRSRGVEAVLRSHDAPQIALSSGADWALVWPQTKRIGLVWAAVASGDAELDIETGNLSRRLESLHLSGEWNWQGLILLAEPAVEAADSDWVDARSHVTVLRFPEDIHLHWGDLQAGLELSIGEVHGA